MIDTSALPFPKGSTKLDRAIASQAARLLDAAKLRQWAQAVKDRDQWRDRRTHQRVLRTLQLDPRGAEAHHVVSASDPLVKFDVRNGVTLSLENHLAVELGRYRIEGTAWFTVRGQRYINADYPIIFVRT